MILSNESPVTPSLTSTSGHQSARMFKSFALLTLLLIISFSRPLYSLIQFAIHSKLYSHIVLIPFVGAYLVWLQRKNLTMAPPQHRGLALLPLIIGIGFLMACWAVLSGKLLAQDYLALMTSAFLCVFMGNYLLLFGFPNFRNLFFPLAFLVFMVPFPISIEQAIETVLQHGSAGAACGLFKLFGMPVFTQGMELHLPGFNMQVAPECSGIRSSLVLFITSLVAGHLLLRASWARAIFVLAVIPLAMLRNGFRIFVLGELCVEVDPAWIDSDLHHRGGPIFFALSLIPFFFLLLFLRKLESRNNRLPSLTRAFRPETFRGSGVPESTEINLTVSTASSSDTPNIKRS